MRQFRQTQDHGFAVTGQGRVLNEIAVQRMFCLGAGDIGGGQGGGLRAIGFFLQPQAQPAVQMGARGRRQIMTRRQPFNDRGPDKAGDTPDGAGGKIRAQRQRQMPGFDFLGLRHHPLQSFLADFRIRIDQQRRHGRHIERLNQCIADLLAQRTAARHRRQHFAHLSAGDDFDQIGIGQQRRIFQHRHGDDGFRIMRQRQHHIARHIGEMLDLFGQGGTHPCGGIIGEKFQGLDGKRHDMGAVPSGQPGHQARDLDRQFDAHILVIIIGQAAIDGGRGGDIGGNGGAGGGRAMLGQILQHRIAGIGALGQESLRLARAYLQYVQRMARTETRFVTQIPIGRGFFHALSFPARSVGPAVLRLVKQAWFPPINKLASRLA